MNCDGRRVMVAAAIIAVFLSARDGGTSQADEFLPMAGNGRFHLPLVPREPTAWTLDDACFGQRFFELIYATHAPEGLGVERDGLVVVSRRGLVWHVFDGRKEALLDLRSRFSQDRRSDDNLMSLAFHPRFSDDSSSQHGAVYLFYTTGDDSEHRYVLSRFVRDPSSGTIDPKQEDILIVQPVPERHHVGGSLTFGSDGYLYVAVGDGSGDFDDHANGQRIDRNLFSGILRIDVDRRGGAESHPLRRQPKSGYTKGYFIPSDNPFVGKEDVLEEFWSIGLRNPHRMSFDRKTGWLWVGDVGQDHVEAVSIAARGSNHGWSFREGSARFSQSYLRGTAPDRIWGQLVLPVYEYEHRDLNNAVIGGYIYRGSRFPELAGKYIFGDHGSGKIWALTVEGSRATDCEELLAVPSNLGRITSFGETSEGEILVCVWKWNSEDCRVMQLARPARAAPPLPPRLSMTGLFRDVSTLEPHEYLVPYEVNLPFWSDGTVKRRWISLPTQSSGAELPAEKITFSREGSWRFPSGTVFVKHFDAPASPPKRPQPVPLETRVIVRDSGEGIYAVTYRWNANGTDATLLDVGEQVSIMEDEVSRFDWTIPSRTDCLACHVKASGWILGVRTRQIAKPVNDPLTGDTGDQIWQWSERGWFSESFTPEQIARLPRHPNLDDQTASLEDRVRAYLDVNCSNCHQPNSGIHANLDLRIETEIGRTNLLNGNVLKTFGIPGAQAIHVGSPDQSILYRRFTSGDPGEVMPPIAHRRVDRGAQAIMAAWIESIRSPQPTSPIPASVRFPRATATYSVDFRRQDAKLPYFGTTTCHVSSTKKGLRITMPAETYVASSAGVRIPARLSGDFMITASYRLLDVPRPAEGHGAGVSLVVQTVGPETWASLQRVHSTLDEQLCVAHLAGRSDTGEPVHSVVATSTASTWGRLRITRSGTMLYYSFADKDSDRFQELRAIEFSDWDVIGVELAAQNGEHPNPVDVLWEDVTIHAQAIETTSLTPPRAKKTILSARLWLAILCAMLSSGSIFLIRMRRLQVNERSDVVKETVP
jgi:uncharacterized repeat protein (TIGR03806 family)